jgi:hypothetical protein
VIIKTMLLLDNGSIDFCLFPCSQVSSIFRLELNKLSYLVDLFWVEIDFNPGPVGQDNLLDVGVLRVLSRRHSEDLICT